MCFYTEFLQKKIASDLNALRCVQIPKLLNFSNLAGMLILFGGAFSVDIKCQFRMGDWWVVGNVYTCEIENNRIASPTEANITSVSGTHKAGRSNAEVIAFYANSKDILYLPRNANLFFVNLKIISFHHCKIKEILQSDLKPFPRITQFILFDNQIKILEAGLFAFNPLLEIIDFKDNQIFQIDAAVFDHLDKLTHLELRNNKCIDSNSFDSTVTRRVIQETKSKC